MAAGAALIHAFLPFLFESTASRSSASSTSGRTTDGRTRDPLGGASNLLLTWASPQEERDKKVWAAYLGEEAFLEDKP